MKRKLLPTVLIFVVICLSNATADISYDNFSSTTGISLIGNAAGQNDVLRLTPSGTDKVGAAWYTEKQQVNMGFETTFSFRISDNYTAGGADGIAFVIQNSSQSAMGQAGGFLGYGKNIWDPSQGGIPNSIAIEFDTFGNALYSDLPSFHVSIQSGGTGENSAVHTYSLGSSMIGYNITDGQVHSAKVKYLSNNLSIFVDNLQAPLLTIPVNLDTLLSIPDNCAYVGFTSATGVYYSTHDILNWSFIEIPEPTTLSLFVLGAAALLRKRK